MKKIAHNSKTLFFDDKPLFGMDIGYDMVRVMQFARSHTPPRLKGYGAIEYDPSAIVDGVIVKPELIAKVVVKLFSKELIGNITTKRVAVSLPTSRSYTHAMQLPKMNAKDMADAVQTEAEQFLPVSLDNVYMDYALLRENSDSVELFVAATPKKIVDSYLTLTRMLGLEAVLFDTAIGASTRLFSLDKRSDVPSVLVDFGAESTDITVFNHGLIVTGTVAFGGDDVTNIVAKTLHITPHEATMVKSKYGLARSEVQSQVISALEPSLNLLIKEIRRTIRYYEQRYVKEPPIGQIVAMGGGASMPGLVDYLTNQLMLPARSFDPTSHIDFGNLRPFYNADRMSFGTVAGLAYINPVEIFA